MMSPLRVIKPKTMKNDKGREGGHKIRKMGQHHLWMAPKVCIMHVQTFNHKSKERFTLYSKQILDSNFEAAATEILCLFRNS